MAKMHQNYTEIGLSKLNFLRIMFVLMIAFGYASTMPLGPLLEDGTARPEKFQMIGYDPSWIGISVLFFFSGILALKSLWAHGSSLKYLESRFLRNIPLLALVTLMLLVFVYPFADLGSEANRGTFWAEVEKLTVYFFGTISCLWASERLPGIMDKAEYMCLLQGAIWTLKWGMIAHIGMAIMNRAGLLINRYFLLAIAILSVILYIVLFQLFITEKFVLSDKIQPGVRLAWPFLAGVAVYAYWDKLPRLVTVNFAISFGLIALAYAYRYNPLPIPWTAGVEVLLISGWAWLGLTLLRLREAQLKFLNNWTPLAVAIYFLTWPTSQILLLMFPSITPWGLIATSLPVSVFLAFFIYVCVAKPLFGWVKSRQPNPALA